MHVILGEDAKQIEDFIGTGERWNIAVEYVFARSGENPVNYLKSISSLWEKGLFYVGGPFFMRRRQAFSQDGFKSLSACRHESCGEVRFLYGKTAEEVAALLDGDEGAVHGLEQVHVNPHSFDSIKAYYDLNMKMVAGEFSRYVTA